MGAQYLSALDAAIENGDRRQAAMLIDIHAQALLTTDRLESSAVLTGYVRAHTRHVGNPYSRTAQERMTTELGAALGDAQFEALLEQGAELDFDGALALSRAELDRVIEGVPSEP